MHEINENHIMMHRGDYASFDFGLQDINGEPYTLQEGERVLFTLRRYPKRNSKDNNWLIQKEITDKIEFWPEDTADLPYGDKYIWDIEYQFDNCTKPDTVLSGTLQLLEEVT